MQQSKGEDDQKRPRQSCNDRSFFLLLILWNRNVENSNLLAIQKMLGKPSKCCSEFELPETSKGHQWAKTFI